MEKEFAYETLPYSNAVFSLTHPDKLCSLARLYGLDAPDVENARILELGCGNGMNLISQAFYYPNSEFVGIDLAQKHVDYAKKSAEELNLSNIDFQQVNLMEMNAEDFGKFDYITAHGLICWIPDFVREKTFLIYKEMLTQKGVGYISHNVYPGWHSRQMLREIATIHTKNFTQPMEKIQNSIAFGAFLAENAVGDNLYKQTLEEEVRRYFDSDAPKLFHDDLAEINHPYYFQEFVEKLEEKDLQFLTEAQHFTMSFQDYPAEAKGFLEDIDNIIAREQYIDFLTGRTFRQTLFCHKENKLNRDLEPDVIEKFYLSSNLKPVSENPDLKGTSVEKFADIYQNEAIEMNHPLTKVALSLLSNEWSNSINCEDLLNKSKDLLEKEGKFSANWDSAFNQTKQIFLQIILSSELMEFHTYKTEIYTELDKKPKINQLIRWQLDKGEAFSTQYERTVKIKEPILKELIGLLDGNNNREDLQNKLADFIHQNDEIQNKEVIINSLSQNIENNLIHFAKRGFFTP